MATMAILLSGFIGFISFLTAYLGFDATFLAATAIYIIAGLVTTAALVIVSILPARPAPQKKQTALSA